MTRHTFYLKFDLLICKTNYNMITATLPQKKIVY